MIIYWFRWPDVSIFRVFAKTRKNAKCTTTTTKNQGSKTKKIHRNTFSGESIFDVGNASNRWAHLSAWLLNLWLIERRSSSPHRTISAMINNITGRPTTQHSRPSGAVPTGNHTFTRETTTGHSTRTDYHFHVSHTVTVLTLYSLHQKKKSNNNRREWVMIRYGFGWLTSLIHCGDYYEWLQEGR